MKSNKGITLTSLVIYVIAMVIVVTTVSTITSYFYKNIDNVNTGTDSSMTYTEFNMYFTQEINTKENYPVLVSDGADYIVFSKTGNQYTFKNSSIYKNQVKICDNIESCTFEMLKTDEAQEKNDLVKVYIKTTGNLEYTNTYKIQSF